MPTRKRTLCRAAFVGIGLGVSILCGWAQTSVPLAPSSLAPKPVEPQITPYTTPQQPRSPRLPEGDKPLNAEKLITIKAIILVKTRAEVQEAGVPDTTGVILRDIPFLNRPDFTGTVASRFLGRELTENAIKDLEDFIILYCRERGKLLVDVILLEQNVENGVLQLWFLEGKIGNLNVKNEGHKWFKDKFILDRVQLRPAESLDAKKLNQDLNWLNNNPFRQVDVTFAPGKELGLTDVDLLVQDRFPARPYLGYENSGTRFSGENRLLAGVNWGRAFGLDHQLNYQYATDIDFDLVKAHSASYIAPLPWHHSLMLYGAYVDGIADFTPIGVTTAAKGTSWQASARYSVPLPEIKAYRHELSAGFDFKRSNNNLEAGGTLVLQTSDVDVAQFVLGYSGVLPDSYGRSSFGLELYYSPGGLTGNNTDAHFDLLRAGSKAEYFYARLNVERIVRLPGRLSWVVRGWGQLATERLTPSEELGVGGYATVRGYDERVLNGDSAWIISNELRTPPWTVGNLLQLRNGRDELQFLAFVDCGGVHLKDSRPEYGEDPNQTVVSVGAGFRWTVSRNFSFRFDYGFPLMERSINAHESKVHVGALLSF